MNEPFQKDPRTLKFRPNSPLVHDRLYPEEGDKGTRPVQGSVLGLLTDWFGVVGSSDVGDLFFYQDYS